MDHDILLAFRGFILYDTVLQVLLVTNFRWLVCGFEKEFAKLALVPLELTLPSVIELPYEVSAPRLKAGRTNMRKNHNRFFEGDL